MHDRGRPSGDRQGSRALKGAHDMGGMQNFGPVRPAASEPVFHSDWERRLYGVAQAYFASGEWNIDESRAANESLPPHLYLSMSYYEIWYSRLVKLSLAGGFFSEEELARGLMIIPPRSIRRVLDAAQMVAALKRGSPYTRNTQREPLFEEGFRVRTRKSSPATHTRLPDYARGRIGEIVKVHGCHVFPDSHATGSGEDPQWLYSVEFSAEELWGKGGFHVLIDAWEPYLERLDREPL